MRDQSKLNEHFAGYLIVDCVVQNVSRFYVVAKKVFRDEKGVVLVEQPDDGDKRIVRVDVSEDSPQFAKSELFNYDWPIFCEMTYPEDRIVIVDSDAKPFVGGPGSLPQIPAAFEGGPIHGAVTRVRPIGDSHVHLITSARDVLIRKAEQQWARVGPDFPRADDVEFFEDFDGFSTEEIYTVGGSGGVFKFDGKRWAQLEFPTNLGVTSVCCGGDGNVYVGSAGGKIYRGKDHEWELIHDDDLALPYRDMVWHDDCLWCCNDSGLWKFKDGKPVDDVPSKAKVCCGHLSSRGGMLLTAGFGGAAWLDADGEWNVLFLSVELQENGGTEDE